MSNINFMATESTKPVVFISYKTREHQIYVDSFKEVLVESGFDVWCDLGRGIPRFCFSGLDFHLAEGLKSSGVILSLKAKQTYELTLAEKQKDTFDAIVLLAVLRFGIPVLGLIQFALQLWYSIVYGVNLRKSPNESWQEWEGRIAEGLCIPIIPIEVSPEEPALSGLSSDVCKVRKQYLEQDVRSCVIPKIEESRFGRKKLEILPEVRKVLPYVKLLAAIVLIFLFILEVIDTIKEAILYIPELMWSALRKALTLIYNFLSRQQNKKGSKPTSRR